MLEKIIVLFIIYAAILGYDYPNLKKTSIKLRLAYGGIMLCALYLSTAYAGNLNWPELYHFLLFLFDRPAEIIVNMMKS
ncbi:hypothetical protein [Paenibacillus sp. LHD-38]|uniref:hypothetical protein n=1 Tax=Paenibacillus sp. LHD-38 TaxID=3072143 RepID=UPI002810047C|nr:hypothetical protein [Paenibacillus sp. LHD-38]MDQ8733518.1 hypothetical protein [Paenibacillus sp. LHD-38]